MSDRIQQKRKLSEDQQNVGIPKRLWEKPYTMERLEEAAEGKGGKLGLSVYRAPRAMQDILPL